jgi:hypothetical protein
MYNRSTTDAATGHLKGHPRLAQYSAFGTQITDESLCISRTRCPRAISSPVRSRDRLEGAVQEAAAHGHIPVG